jgi:hypothetical protein
MFLKRGIKFETHSWPGTNSVISETTRSGLEVGLHQVFVCCCVRFEVVLVGTIKVAVLCHVTRCIW